VGKEGIMGGWEGVEKRWQRGWGVGGVGECGGGGKGRKGGVRIAGWGECGWEGEGGRVSVGGERMERGGRGGGMGIRLRGRVE